MIDTFMRESARPLLGGCVPCSVKQPLLSADLARTVLRCSWADTRRWRKWVHPGKWLRSDTGWAGIHPPLRKHHTVAVIPHPPDVIGWTVVLVHLYVHVYLFHSVARWIQACTYTRLGDRFCSKNRHSDTRWSNTARDLRKQRAPG